MYLVGSSNRTSSIFVSPSVREVIGSVIDISDSVCQEPLYFMQQVCRNYKDFIIQPETYWVLRDTSTNVVLPDIMDVCNKLILFGSIDHASNLSDRLGICINHLE